MKQVCYIHNIASVLESSIFHSFGQDLIWFSGSYRHDGREDVIVYNHAHSLAHRYYEKLGGEVMRTDYQMDGQLKVDIFYFKFDELLKKIESPPNRWLDSALLMYKPFAC